MIFVANQFLVVSMDLTAYKDGPTVVSSGYFMEGSPPTSPHSTPLLVTKIMYKQTEVLVRMLWVVNVLELSELKDFGQNAQLAPVPAQISCVCLFSLQCSMGGRQPLGPVCAVFPTAQGLWDIRMWCCDLPIWALPGKTKKKNLLPRLLSDWKTHCPVLFSALNH